MFLNVHTVIGNLTADPNELKYVGQNASTPMTSFNVAVNRDFAKDGQTNCDFFKVTIFGRDAKYATENFHKGDKVAVMGSTEIDHWNAADGTEKTTVVIRAKTVKLLRPKSEAPASTAPEVVTQDDDNFDYDDPFGT